MAATDGQHDNEPRGEQDVFAHRALEVQLSRRSIQLAESSALRWSGYRIPERPFRHAPRGPAELSPPDTNVHAPPVLTGFAARKLVVRCAGAEPRPRGSGLRCVTRPRPADHLRETTQAKSRRPILPGRVFPTGLALSSRCAPRKSENDP